MKFYDYIILGIISIILIIVLIKLIKLDKNQKSSVSSNVDVKDSIERSNINITNKVTESNMALSNLISSNVKDEYIKLSDNLNKKIEDLNKSVESVLKTGFIDTNTRINDFEKEIASFNKTNQSLSKSISEIEIALNNNKSVGNFGEFLLEQILANYFGNDEKLYKVQYTFDNKNTVDAAILMPQYIIPIDSKFPLYFYREYIKDENNNKEEILKNFNIAVKKQIKEIKDKYIIKNVTSDYAVMFVPSDGILELIHTTSSDLLDYASSSKVILVSPSTLVPFISSLRMVKYDYLRNKQVTKLYENVSNLSKDFKLFVDRERKLFLDFEKINSDIENINIVVNRLENKFEKIENMDLGEIEEK